MGSCQTTRLGGRMLENKMNIVLLLILATKLRSLEL